MGPARVALGGLFIFTGVLHFVRPEMYEAVMPPWIPAHRELVLISGAAELAGGVGALVPGAERVSKWWLLILLTAIFPANVHMALNPEDIKDLRDFPEWLLWARLPLQLVLAWWVVRALRRRGHEVPALR